MTDESMAEMVSAEPIELGPAATTALEVLREICEVSGLDMKPVVTSQHDCYLDVNLVGPDAAEILGRNGKMLDALQYMANLVVVKRTGPGLRIMLDADGYRARREQMLCDLATEYATEVRDRQEECELDPLPPHERRIIHKALQDFEGVRTFSEGDEPERRVVIAPK